ncbi:hypothetical protein D7Y40_14395 [Stenotrophomonas maltophilia]|nr:hypothetical protein [Stenotrophomonas maltophilia]MBA0540700.1 hypothetical protein [Stenotrophomonas maltophilia]REC81250.1 hypothetical protein DXK52_18945 [Stenotrophomonas maltophilia]
MTRCEARSSPCPPPSATPGSSARRVSKPEGVASRVSVDCWSTALHTDPRKTRAARGSRLTVDSTGRAVFPVTRSQRVMPRPAGTQHSRHVMGMRALRA